MAKGEQIVGEVFSPCFLTEEDFENAYKESVFYVEGDYMEEYRKHLSALGHIANIAKVYILKNWKQVSDWSGLNVEITHGPSGKTTKYYNYVPHDQDKRSRSEIWDRIMADIDERNKALHNPILEINNVVLDPTDGDFSITINGDQEHWWIGDEEVIIIADYIEKKLKTQK